MIAAAALTIIGSQIAPALGLTAQLRAAQTHLSPRADADHASYDHPSWLPDCSLIYLDVGSNIGVQVRKLYEPEKYPNAQLLPDFTRSFGSPEYRRRPAAESGLCALGLEPNPAHRERLGNLSEAYRQRGWRVHFYPVAAWSQEGTLAFNTTAPRSSPDDTTAVGAHLQMQNSERKKAAATDEASLLSEMHDTDVRTVNLASFVRSLPTGAVQIMKMDIEGAEWETLAEMLREDILCKETVAAAFIEAHGWGETTNWGARADFKIGRPRSFDAIQEKIVALDASGICSGPATQVVSLDDESYPHDVDDDFFGTGTRSIKSIEVQQETESSERGTSERESSERESSEREPSEREPSERESSERESSEPEPSERDIRIGDWSDVLRVGDGNYSNLVGTVTSEDPSARVLESLHSSVASTEANATRDAELRLESVLTSMGAHFAVGEQGPKRSVAEMVDDILSSKGSGNRPSADVGGASSLFDKEASPVAREVAEPSAAELVVSQEEGSSVVTREVAEPSAAEIGKSDEGAKIVDAGSFADATGTGDDDVLVEKASDGDVHVAIAIPTSEVNSTAAARESAGRSGAEVDGTSAHSPAAGATALASPVTEEGGASAILANATRSVAELERGAAIDAFRGSSAALHRTSGVAARRANGTAADGSTHTANSTEVGSLAGRNAARALAKDLRSTVASHANTTWTSASDLGDRNTSVAQSFVASAKAMRELRANNAQQNKTEKKAYAPADDVVIATYKVIDGEVVKVSDSSVSKEAPKQTTTPKHAKNSSAVEAPQFSNETAAFLSARRRAVGIALKNAILATGINLTHRSPF